VLFSEDEILTRVDQLGRQISEDYASKNLLLVGILKGSFVFLADLVRSISLPLSVDFITLSSYRNSTESSGLVEILSEMREDIPGKDVIIVDDIVDTGWTIRMSGIIEYLLAKGAESVRICALLDKPSRRRVDLVVDYVGFSIPDKFVVGYGLDLQGLHRNLRYIGCIEQAT
jgi:hypoxanthine phosphoribosyltransferase